MSTRVVESREYRITFRRPVELAMPNAVNKSTVAELLALVGEDKLGLINVVSADHFSETFSAENLFPLGNLLEGWSSIDATRCTDVAIDGGIVTAGNVDSVGALADCWSSYHASITPALGHIRRWL